MKILKPKKNSKSKVAAPTYFPKSVEVAYRKQLLQLVKRLRKDIAEHVVPLLKSLEPEFTKDEYSLSFEQAFDNVRKLYANIEPLAQQMSNTFVSNEDRTHKNRFYRSIKRAIGVDLNQVVQNEGLEDVLRATTKQNVSLIKSIPSQYLDKVENLVYRETVVKSTASSMIKEIVKIGRVTENRARVIARDQTAKLNSALTQQRQTNLGIEEYIWEHSRDGRVRASHRKNGGKTFRWDTPPAETGHPGHDPQCRCVPRAVINL